MSLDRCCSWTLLSILLFTEQQWVWGRVHLACAEGHWRQGGLPRPLRLRLPHLQQHRAQGEQRGTWDNKHLTSQLVTHFRPTLSNTVLTTLTLSENKRSWRKSGKLTGSIFSYVPVTPESKSSINSRSPKPPSPPPPELYSRPRPLVSSSGHNTRLGSSSSPTFFFNNSSSSSSPLMSPNSSGYFSHPSSPTYSCYSSPVRQQQQVQQQSVHHQHQQLPTNENIVYENLIKLLQFSSWKTPKVKQHQNYLFLHSTNFVLNLFFSR